MPSTKKPTPPEPEKSGPPSSIRLQSLLNLFSSPNLKRPSFLKKDDGLSHFGLPALTPTLLARVAPPVGVIAAATNFLASSACCLKTCKPNKGKMISSFNQTGDQLHPKRNQPKKVLFVGSIRISQLL